MFFTSHELKVTSDSAASQAWDVLILSTFPSSRYTCDNLLWPVILPIQTLGYGRKLGQRGKPMHSQSDVQTSHRQHPRSGLNSGC